VTVENNDTGVMLPQGRLDAGGLTVGQRSDFNRPHFVSQTAACLRGHLTVRFPIFLERQDRDAELVDLSQAPANGKGRFISLVKDD